MEELTRYIKKVCYIDKKGDLHTPPDLLQHLTKNIKLEEIAFCYINCLLENDSLKEINSVLELQLENMQIQKTDYTKINILEMKNTLLEKKFDELNNFLKKYHKYRDSFKWNEQDYIDTINEIEKILKENYKC